MKIAISSSAKFFDKLSEIKKGLEERGYEVYTPSLKDSGFEGEDSETKIHYNLIQEHFNQIDGSDGLYVANYDKNGISGYIGGNTFLEMGKAFDCGIPILLLKEIPDVSHRDEIVAMQPEVVGKNWDKIEEIIRESTN